MKPDETNTGKSAAYKKIRRQRIVIGIFCFLIFILICLFSPLFNVSEVSVSGTNVLSPDDVIDASDIKKGDNFLFVDTDKSEEAIMALGYVDKVKVKRKFFTRIEIEVVEATECAYITFAGSYVGIDANCKVLSITKTGKLKPKKAVIKGFGIKSPEKGQPVNPKDKNKLAVIKELLKLLKDKKLIKRTTEIRISDIKDISFVLDGETKVILGDSAELDYKIEFTNEILKNQDGKRGGGTIDVSNPSSVIVE